MVAPKFVSYAQPRVSNTNPDLAGLGQDGEGRFGKVFASTGGVSGVEMQLQKQLDQQLQQKPSQSPSIS